MIRQTNNRNSRYAKRDTSRLLPCVIRRRFRRLKNPGIFARKLDIARRVALNPPLSASQILARENIGPPVVSNGALRVRKFVSSDSSNYETRPIFGSERNASVFILFLF